jgi:hypothetical protein
MRQLPIPCQGAFDCDCIKLYIVGQGTG